MQQHRIKVRNYSHSLHLGMYLQLAAYLPTVGKARQRTEPHVIELVVGADDAMRLRIDGKDAAPLRLDELKTRVLEAQASLPKNDDGTQTPVVISADRNVKYESVVKAMDVLQRAGVQRVGLSVKSNSKP